MEKLCQMMKEMKILTVRNGYFQVILKNKIRIMILIKKNLFLIKRENRMNKDLLLLKNQRCYQFTNNIRKLILLT